MQSGQDETKKTLKSVTYFIDIGSERIEGDCPPAGTLNMINE